MIKKVIISVVGSSMAAASSIATDSRIGIPEHLIPKGVPSKYEDRIRLVSEYLAWKKRGSSLSIPTKEVSGTERKAGNCKRTLPKLIEKRRLNSRFPPKVGSSISLRGAGRSTKTSNQRKLSADFDVEKAKKMSNAELREYRKRIAPDSYDKSDMPESGDSKGLQNGDSRKLQDGGPSSDQKTTTASDLELCHPFWLEAFYPSPYHKFNSCLSVAWNTADFSIVAKDQQLSADCWCNNNSKEGWQNMYEKEGDGGKKHINCCEHSYWSNLCNLDCNADCTDARTAECKTQCSSFCLEFDYAHLASGPCACDSCFDKIKCLLDHAHDETIAGNLDRVCDIENFEKTSEAAAWLSCVENYPHGTQWEQAQASEWCVCKSNLENALDSSHCCTHRNYDHLCGAEAKCKTVDCSTTEAAECVKDCETLCDSMMNRSSKCDEQCFREGGRCKKYMVCEPSTTKDHGYICDDGVTKPDLGGCCSRKDAPFSTPSNIWCPRFCKFMTVFYMSVPGRYECDCSNCPQTMAGILTAWQASIKTYLEEYLQPGINRLSRRLSLTTTTEADLFALLSTTVSDCQESIPYSETDTPKDSISGDCADSIAAFQQRAEDLARDLFREINPTTPMPDLTNPWTTSDAVWDAYTATYVSGGVTKAPTATSNNNYGPTYDNPNQDSPITNAPYARKRDHRGNESETLMYLFLIPLAILGGMVLVACLYHRYGKKTNVERMSLVTRSPSNSRANNAAANGVIQRYQEAIVVGQPVGQNSQGIQNVPTGFIVDSEPKGDEEMKRLEMLRVNGLVPRRDSGAGSSGAAINTQSRTTQLTSSQHTGIAAQNSNDPARNSDDPAIGGPTCSNNGIPALTNGNAGSSFVSAAGRTSGNTNGNGSNDYSNSNIQMTTFTDAFDNEVIRDQAMLAQLDPETLADITRPARSSSNNRSANAAANNRSVISGNNNHSRNNSRSPTNRDSATGSSFVVRRPSDIVRPADMQPPRTAWESN